VEKLKKGELSFCSDAREYKFTTMNQRTFWALAGALSLAQAHVALLKAAPAAQPAKTIAVHQFPKEAKLVDQVVVPVPSEVFAVLDKLGKPSWPEVLRPQKSMAAPTGSKEQVSLMLGVVIAEGFIAVEAENSEEVKNIGNSVRSLAKAIGVERAVRGRANSIVEFADKRRWMEVRKELDLALADVRQAMIELNSESLAQLVSLGGWLRGTEALAAVVSKSFSKDGAELLHQPVLIEHFNLRLKALPGEVQKGELIAKVLAGLKNIQPLMGVSSGDSISEKDVRDIGQRCAELVAAVQAKGK
jgi:hypothetical protein